MIEKPKPCKLCGYVPGIDNFPERLTIICGEEDGHYLEVSVLKEEEFAEEKVIKLWNKLNEITENTFGSSFNG